MCLESPTASNERGWYMFGWLYGKLFFVVVTSNYISNVFSEPTYRTMRCTVYFQVVSSATLIWFGCTCFDIY